MMPATPPAVVPVVATPGPLDRNPAAVYLRSKPSARWSPRPRARP